VESAAMFRLILIYPHSYPETAPDYREYTERVFETMADLLHYLHSVNEDYVYRILIERF
jgi:hypothetical protein